ncbi:MAG: hypothetical protein O2948_01105 [Proteobacteria bacterium]|nr:hypothetical protein [Pseudomonadota bacterium]MDA0927278.1 hypothetical protein [Pseudomonadota bacterium]
MKSRLLISFILLLSLAACDDSPAPQVATTLDEVMVEEIEPLAAELEIAIRELMGVYLNRIDVDLADASNNFQLFSAEVETFLQEPSEERLNALRDSWLEVHNSYEATAIHRFFADEVLDEQQALILFDLQYQLDHWPILPGYIDYVGDYPESGIVNDMTVPLETVVLREKHGEFDISEASTGFHVLEFMLWGENGDGSGLRPYSDYLAATTLSAQQRADGLQLFELSPNRRRDFLTLNAALLEDDFQALVNAWSANSVNYRARIDTTRAEQLLMDLLNAITGMFSDELMVRTLYPMLNGEFDESLPAIYSDSSPATVSAQLAGLENLLQEPAREDGVNLDTVLSALSEDFEEFFYQNFDASKECLVVLYATEQAPQTAQQSADLEFKVVECINLLTNMIDYLEQIKRDLILKLGAIA